MYDAVPKILSGAFLFTFCLCLAHYGLGLEIFTAMVLSIVFAVTVSTILFNVSRFSGLVHRVTSVRSTLWLTGLLTAGVMLVAGIMWGLFGRVPN